MESNFKLIEKNSFLQNENKKYKDLYRNNVTYIKALEKQVSQLKKALFQVKE